MGDSHDYYKILGLKRSASLLEIKSRFRQLALRYHPDRNPGDSRAEERFKLVAEAYHVLSDQQRRHLYHRRGSEGLRERGYRGFQRTEEVFRTFGAEFFSFLGLSGSEPQRGPLPGADICLDLELSPEEAALGIKKTVQITRMESCSQCRGSGSRPSSATQPCAWCQGSGRFRAVSSIFTAAGTCPKCGGKGRLAQISCEGCGGLGRRQVEQALQVDIPTAVIDKTRLRIARWGDGGEDGAQPGDLYLVLHVRKIREENS
jgi:molecular chaperone DnaJ